MSESKVAATVACKGHDISPDAKAGTVTKCRRCRKSVRVPERKQCSKCGQVKPLSEFAILRGRRSGDGRVPAGDGYHAWCLECKRTYGTNPDMVVRVPPAVMAAIRREREKTGRSLSGIVCDVLTREFAPGTTCQNNHADFKGDKRQWETVRVEVLVTTTARAEAEAANLWRCLDLVDFVVVDDAGEPERVALVVAPRHLEKVTRFLGGRPELLPEPGSCDDALVPPEREREEPAE